MELLFRVEGLGFRVKEWRRFFFLLLGRRVPGVERILTPEVCYHWGLLGYAGTTVNPPLPMTTPQVNRLRA